MGIILLGNAFALMAAVTDSVSGTRKSTKSVLGWQIFSQFFHAASSLVLKGYSAVVQNVVAVFRNLFAMSGKKSKVIEWILTVAAVALGVYFNNRGLLGLLPVVANLEYTVCVFRFKDEERKLKIAFFVSMMLFVVFNAVILNFVGAVMDFAVAATTAVNLIRNRKEN